MRMIELALERLAALWTLPRSLVGIVVFLAGVVGAAEHRFTIDNPLNLDWPGELIHLDIPEANASGDWVAVYDDKTVPAQVEPGAAGDGKTRLWFIASLAD